jgi:hypothetical protein
MFVRQPEGRNHHRIVLAEVGCVDGGVRHHIINSMVLKKVLSADL